MVVESPGSRPPQNGPGTASQRTAGDDVARGIPMLDVKGRQAESVRFCTVQEHPIVELRLVFRNHKKTRDMRDPGSAKAAQRPRHLGPDQGSRRSGQLLNPTELAAWPPHALVTEVEVVDAELLVEEALRIRGSREDPQDNLVVVP